METPTPSMNIGLFMPGIQTSRPVTPAAMQVSCMSGRSASGVVRMKTLPAAPLLANGPLPKKNQRSTETTARSKRSSLLILFPSAFQPTNRNGWSTMLRPTPGRSEMTSTPCDCRCSAGPIPDSIRICGEEMVPPDRITSRLAWTVRISPPVSYSTPVARLFSITTLRVSAPDWTVRFGRLSAGSRNTFEVAPRRPRRVTVTSQRWAPSVSSPWTSSVAGQPAAIVAAFSSGNIWS